MFFGGGIKESESPEQAVRREFAEELQIDIADLNFFIKTIDAIKDLERYYFLMDLDADINTLGNRQQEGDDISYFFLEEMESLKINQAHYQTLLNFFESDTDFT